MEKHFDRLKRQHDLIEDFVNYELDDMISTSNYKEAFHFLQSSYIMLTFFLGFQKYDIERYKNKYADELTEHRKESLLELSISVELYLEKYTSNLNNIKDLLLELNHGK